MYTVWLTRCGIYCRRWIVRFVWSNVHQMCRGLVGYEEESASNLGGKVRHIENVLVWNNDQTYCAINLTLKFNFLTETAFYSLWYLLKAFYRNFHEVWRTVHSNVFTRIKKIWNHNHWEYDLYPTVMSKFHESPCIQSRVCENISNSTFDAIYANLLLHNRGVTDFRFAGDNIWP
jgi:hypothetical protein